MNKIKKRFYSNISLQAPDGELLCYIDKRRVNWYLKRNLIKQISDNTYRLIFEPKGRPAKDEKIILRDNRCIVCGEDNILSKHHIIPRMFRIKFPNKYKSRNSYDVMILCCKCHNKYESIAQNLKNELARDIGIFPLNMPYSKEMRYELKINRYIYILKDKELYSKIPPERLELIKKEVEQSGIKETYNLKEILNKNRCNNSAFVEKVIEKYGIEGLILFWRKHFIETMKPNFLPEQWTIDGNLTCRPDSKEIIL